MRHVRHESSRTRARRQRAERNRQLAIAMLKAEPERLFPISNRTSEGDDNHSATIHYGTAKTLVLQGIAEYPTYQHNGQTWRDMGALRRKVK